MCSLMLVRFLMYLFISDFTQMFAIVVIQWLAWCVYLAWQNIPGGIVLTLGNRITFKILIVNLPPIDIATFMLIMLSLD